MVENVHAVLDSLLNGAHRVGKDTRRQARLVGDQAGMGRDARDAADAQPGVLPTSAEDDWVCDEIASGRAGHVRAVPVGVERQRVARQQQRVRTAFDQEMRPDQLGVAQAGALAALAQVNPLPQRVFVPIAVRAHLREGRVAKVDPGVDYADQHSLAHGHNARLTLTGPNGVGRNELRRARREQGKHLVRLHRGDLRKLRDARCLGRGHVGHDGVEGESKARGGPKLPTQRARGPQRQPLVRAPQMCEIGAAGGAAHVQPSPRGGVRQLPGDPAAQPRRG